MDTKVTIKDIAREAGVSETTISRYINQKFEYMSANTRQKIERIIEEMDYRPSSIARSLKSNKSKIIGAVIADIENPFSSIIIKGLSDQCEKLGYSLLIAVSDESVAKEQRHIQRFIDNQVDGLIVNTCGQNEAYLKELNDKKFPMVLLDRCITDNIITTVSTNNYDIGKIAMNYLVEAGFSSIGFFVNPLVNSVRRDRLRAFEDKRVDVEASEQYIISESDTSALYDAIIQFRKLPEPRVIFAANGALLLAIIDAMKDLNYSISTDFSVMGYDELSWSKVLGQGITTIEPSSYKLACRACDELVEKLENAEYDKEAINIEIPAKLVIRDSTKI